MNRRERRKIEKQYGLLKEYQKAGEAKKKEIRDRRKEVGVRLHQQHLEQMENARRKEEDDNQIKVSRDEKVEAVRIDEVMQTFDRDTKNRPYDINDYIK